MLSSALNLALVHKTHKVPVLIRAGNLGMGIPYRDLWVGSSEQGLDAGGRELGF